MWRKIVAIVLAIAMYGAAIYYKETQSLASKACAVEGPCESAWVAAVGHDVSGRLTDPSTLVEIAVEVREHAIARVMYIEGGYADHKRDPGGPTKFGITQRTARAHGYKGHVMNMNSSQAEAIYRILWDEAKAGAVDNQELAFQYFDAYINHGPVAVKWLAQVTPLGYPNACLRINDLRMQAYQSSKNWKTFGKGWAKRIAYGRQECLA